MSSNVIKSAMRTAVIGRVDATVQVFCCFDARRLASRRLLALLFALGVGTGFLLTSPTAEAANRFGCVGDCNETGHVTINELIRCMNGALLGRDARPGCFEVCDVDGDGKIRIYEIIRAVNHALDGCPPYR